MTPQPPHRYILVDRCWELNHHDKGCPFAQFISYELGFHCVLTNRDTWQQGRDDPKIVKDTDGFPIFCPLKKYNPHSTRQEVSP